MLSSSFEKRNDFIYEMLYTNHMVTTKQKSKAEKQNIKKKKLKKNQRKALN